MKFKSLLKTHVFFTAAFGIFMAMTAFGSGARSWGGCTNANTPGMCMDHVGTLYTAAAVKNACERVGGHFIFQACPTTSRIGSCTAGKPETKIIYRYDSHYEGGVGAARKACTAARGTFSMP